MPLLGNVACNFKKNRTLTQDLSTRCIATRGGKSVPTYPRRPKVEAFDNAVDVVKLLLAPTDQVLITHKYRGTIVASFDK